MTRILLIFILHSFFICVAKSQVITVDDLLTLSTIPPKNIDNYMNKKGFLPSEGSLDNNVTAVSFFQKRNKKQKDTLAITRTVDMYRKGDCRYFALHTSSVEEYMNQRSRLKKAGYFFDKNRDTSETVSLLFQKRYITILADSNKRDKGIQYTFLLQKKELPDPASIRYAEDLLKFDSHEYLASYFGENNVKKDVYYFTEKEFKKCSVLFPNTSQQAIFIWNDEANSSGLSYVLISGILPTLSAVQYTRSVSQNKWILKNGIYSGMSLKDLLQLNGNDFKFYGRNSEFSFLVVPENTGSLDFKKIGLMLGCMDCNSSPLLDKSKISAADALDDNLSLHIFYIMIAP